MITIREYKRVQSLEEAYELNQKKSNRVIGGMIWLKMETLNVGNMSQSDETRSITRSINVVDADVEAFHKLHEKGVKLTAQMVPNDPVEDFMKLLK